MVENEHENNFDGDDKSYIRLRNPCILDCHTEIGVVSLILDKDQPGYLFVSIGGELRKCYSLKDYNIHFDGNSQVIDFLQEVSNSGFMKDLIEKEKDLEEGWDAL